MPGDSYFRTPTWAPGERVIQRYQPVIDDVCAGGETVRVVAAWYEYLAGNLRRPRLDAPGDLAVAGELRLPLLPVDPATLAIANPADRLIDATLALKGFALEGRPEPGAPLTLESLPALRAPAAATTPLTVTLAATDGGAPVELLD